MTRLEEAYNYGNTKLLGTAEFLLNNVETIAVAACGAGLLTLAYIGLRTWKNGEGQRIMRKAKHLEEERMLSDGFSEVIDREVEAGRMTHQRAHYWAKQLGHAFSLTDMIPRTLPEELKKKLKRKRYSNKPDAIAALQEAIEPAALPDATLTKEKPNVLDLFKTGKAA